MRKKKLKAIAAISVAAALTAGSAAYVRADDPAAYTTYITVINADTGDTIDGAEVSRLVTVDGTTTAAALGTTNTAGQVSGSFESGDIRITASKSGYTSASQTFTVEPSNGNFFTIEIVPTRFGVQMPAVVTETEDANGDPSEQAVNVKLLLRRTSTATTAKAWNGGESSLELASASQTTLPEGEYTVTNASTGYTHDVTMKIDVATDGTVTYYAADGVIIAKSTDTGGTVTYEDGSGNTMTVADFTAVYKMTVTALGDPTYRVKIEDGGLNDNGVQTYTAKVTLENIAATYGTFGLKYDTNALDFNETTGITMGSGLVQKMTPHLAYADAMTAANSSWTGWDDDNGYYIFVWQAGSYADTPTNDDVFDTTLGACEVATLTFTLASGADTSDVNAASFSVMRWQDTVEAREDAAVLIAAYPGDPVLNPAIVYNEYWRDIDDDNDSTLNPSGLPEGRLDKSKASVYYTSGGTMYEGFFQAAVNGTLAETTPMRFYDVKTILDSDLPENIIKGTIKAFNPRSDKAVTVRAYREGDTTSILGTAALTAINADGSVEYSYSITLADPADYILEIAKPEHLTYKCAMAGITAVPFDVELICGDCNGDEHIKVPDRVYLIRYFNQQRPWYYPGSAADAAFNKADLNGDGCVNFFDLNIIKGNMSRYYV